MYLLSLLNIYIGRLKLLYQQLMAFAQPLPRAATDHEDRPDAHGGSLRGGTFYPTSLDHYDPADLIACEKSWRPVAARGYPPLGRCSHTSCTVEVDGTIKFIIIGGGSFADGVWTHYGDIHEFNATTKTWSDLTPSAECLQLPPRRGHTAAVHQQRFIYVFGGTSGGVGRGGLRNDMWRFDLVGGEWTRVDALGAPPAPRRGAVCTISDRLDQLWQFGGDVSEGEEREGGMDSKLYRLDLKTMTWHIQTTRGVAPLVALTTSTLIDVRGQTQLVIFGGCTFDPVAYTMPLSNNVWMCSMADTADGCFTWSSLECDGEAPSPRFCHCASSIFKHLVVFGGTGRGDGGMGSETYNDTHILDLSQARPRWQAVAVSDGSVAPSERNGFTMARVGPQFFIFGGGVYETAYYNDVHVFKLQVDPGIAIPEILPHVCFPDDLADMLESATLVDCKVGSTSCQISAHRAVLHARCPALSKQLSQAGAVISLDDLFCSDDYTVCGPCRAASGATVEWPSVVRMFLWYVYTGTLWPRKFANPFILNQVDHGQSEAAVQCMEKLLAGILRLQDVAHNSLGLPLLSESCDAEAVAIRARLQLFRCRMQSCDSQGVADDIPTYLASSTRTKDEANELFRSGDFPGAIRLYTVALDKIAFLLQPPDKAAPESVKAWVTLLSNRAEAWLRSGHPLAAMVDLDNRFGALHLDPGHVKSRDRWARASEADVKRREKNILQLRSDMCELLSSSNESSQKDAVVQSDAAVMQNAEPPFFDAVLRLVDDGTPDATPTTIAVHRAVLCCRSEYFNALFMGNFSEGDGQSSRCKIVDLFGINSVALQQVVGYLYTGEMPAIGEDPTSLMTLYGVAHQLGCETLQLQCETLLVDAIDSHQVCDVLLIAEHYARTQLQMLCLGYIEEHLQEVRDSEGFSRLSFPLKATVGALADGCIDAPS
jgi:N-acetylneuraminic acid mutarotase